MPALDLVPIWTAILAIGVFFYVALDGFDLGVGMLYNFAPDRNARDLVMNSIAPIWDGNETWLILGSVGLLAAFPVAFAIIIPAVYFPILLDAAGADLPRARLRIPLSRRRASHVLGSRLCRGLSARRLSPKAWCWARSSRATRSKAATSSAARSTASRRFPFSAGFALMFGYALLGAGWLIIKTEGALQDWARALGRKCLIGTVLAIAIVSLWTPWTDPKIATRWFSWPHIAYLAPVPIVTAALVLYAWRSLNDRSEYGPFIAGLGLFVMSYIGIAISLWPMIVPGHFTLYQAAAVAEHARVPPDRHAVPACRSS